MNGTEPKRATMVSVWVALGVVAVIFSLLGIFLFAFGGGGGTRTEQTASSTAEPEPGRLAFSASAYEVEVKQETDMTKYLNRNGLTEEDVVWSADSSQVIVGSNGRIVINDYGVDCRLTAKSRKDEAVASTCQIRTRSPEDDLVYSVQNLNGGHTEDATAEDGAVMVATDEDESRTIDVDEENYSCGKRSGKYKWDRTLFYRLEDASDEDDTDNQINTYTIEKKQFRNKDTGNDMEYEIYRHPDTGIIHKIVSIEHKDKLLAMMEYYFTDKGKVNFIYSYEDVNYVPTYAQIAKSGERYMFHKDTMVNWRIVDESGQRNYCYGKAQKKALAGHPNIREYSDFTKKRKKSYDEREKRMLNCAYNTLNKVKNYEGVSSIRGYVSDSSGGGVGETAVSLRSRDYDCEVFTAQTDDKGYYEIRVPARESHYELAFSKDSYTQETLYNIVTDVGRIGVYQETVYLASDTDTAQECELSFYDALHKSDSGEGMMPLTDVDVAIRRGVNCLDGEAVVQEHVSGAELSTRLEPGMYTVHVSCEDYMDSDSSLFVSAQSENQMEIYATPELAEDELRIVLTWGETPRDLDSHLFVPGRYSSEENGNHVSYYHMSLSDGSAALDVDDTTSYGPETTSIYKLARGQYKYYVADFTNCSAGREDSYDMSNSSAVVRVYGSGGLLQTFYVPVNRSGVLWEVFEIRDGNIIPLQRYYDVIGDKTWWSSAKS